MGFSKPQKMFHKGDYEKKPFIRIASDILRDERTQKPLSAAEKKWLKRYKEQQRIKNKQRRKK